MIWYKFHLGDYITHTVHLSDAEDLCYRRLLDVYYMSEACLPLDTQSLAKRVRLDKDIVEDVLNEYFDMCEDGYHHSRCDAEIAKYQSQVKTNKELASRPRNRANAQKQPIVSQGLEENSQSLANGLPNKIQIQIKKKDISSSFDDFWAIWPNSKRKVAKSACEKKWKSNQLDNVAQSILSHVNVMKKSEQWTTGFEPAPLTYLNQRRWEDGSDYSPSTPFLGRVAI
jgi:uncharacterized protein YdaU (DUF1376 family)